MECELCRQAFDGELDLSLPKVIKACPHTYCQKCLLGIKEREGKVSCPVCTSLELATPTIPQDPAALPTNEHLLKALDFKTAEESARFKISKYELLSPEVTDKLPNVDETLKRKHPPHELRLQEVTPEGEIVYVE